MSDKLSRLIPLTYAKTADNYAGYTLPRDSVLDNGHSYRL